MFVNTTISSGESNSLAERQTVLRRVKDHRFQYLYFKKELAVHTFFERKADNLYLFVPFPSKNDPNFFVRQFDSYANTLLHFAS